MSERVCQYTLDPDTTRKEPVACGRPATHLCVIDHYSKRFEYRCVFHSGPRHVQSARALETMGER